MSEASAARADEISCNALGIDDLIMVVRAINAGGRVEFNTGGRVEPVQLREELSRQNLKTGQRAAIGAMLQAASSAGLNAASRRQSDWRDIAAEMVGVHAWAIRQAAAIRNRAPVEFDRLLRGQVDLAVVYRQTMGIRRRKSREEAAAEEAPAPGRNVRMEQCAKNRMIEVLSRIRGLCRGVAEMQTPLIAAALTAEERQTWVEISCETSGQLRNFARKLGAER